MERATFLMHYGKKRNEGGYSGGTANGKRTAVEKKNDGSTRKITITKL